LSGAAASAGAFAPSGWRETESGPLLSSGIQCLSIEPPACLTGATSKL
jgi:hypothetical protein